MFAICSVIKIKIFNNSFTPTPKISAKGNSIKESITNTNPPIIQMATNGDAITFESQNSIEILLKLTAIIGIITNCADIVITSISNIVFSILFFLYFLGILLLITLLNITIPSTPPIRKP